MDIQLDDIQSSTSEVDLLELDEALTRLAALDARKARLVELRFFSGLTMEQSASVLNISVATAQRDWIFARAWLHREISAEKPDKG